MAYLEQAKLISPMLGLRKLPERFALGCYLLELFDRLSPEGLQEVESRELFGFALAALETLEECLPDSRLRVLLELRTLEALGLRPELRSCVRCSREPRGASVVGFSNRRRGSDLPVTVRFVRMLLRPRFRCIWEQFARWSRFWCLGWTASSGCPSGPKLWLKHP